jgi:uncharacterized Zn-binding protein involved in type VI secretion
MGSPAARQTDQVAGSDTHVVLVPSPAGAPVPTPTPGFAFSGQIESKTWTDVRIEDQPAATVGSVARNVPAHVPPPGTSFARQPSNQGSVSSGSSSVNIRGKAAARQGDPVRTCNDPVDLDAATISSGAKSVNIG